MGFPRGARLRSDARHILAPAFLLMLSMLTRTVPFLLPPASLPSLSLTFEILQRALVLSAGLLLAHSVLRFGSPAGQPVHHRLSPIPIVLTVAVLVDIVPLLHPGHTAGLSYLIAPLLTGLLAGVLLARPESLWLSDRWLGRSLPMESGLAHRLQAAWRTLAAQDIERLSLEDLRRALQREINAGYVEVLERAVDPTKSNGRLFTGGAAGSIVRLSSDDIEWPITESSAGRRGIHIDGLPGPASLILPILMDGAVIGILAIGEPERGGMYGRSDILRAEMLARFLVAACSANVPLVEHAAARSAPAHPAKAAPWPLSIRAFGRLEVIAPGNPLVRTRTIALRPRQLLAFLLTAHPEAVPAETLMERLWPEAPPKMAANCLYVAVHALRRVLQPGLASGMPSRYVLHEGDAYRLQLDGSIWADVREFEDCYRRGQHLARANDTEATIREFQKAVALYRGPFLREVALNQSPEVEAVRHRLRRQCGEMARFVVQQLMEQGGLEMAEELLLSLRQADPWDETFIDLLAQIGRQVDPSTAAPRQDDHSVGAAAGPGVLLPAVGNDPAPLPPALPRR